MIDVHWLFLLILLTVLTVSLALMITVGYRLNLLTKPVFWLGQIAFFALILLGYQWQGQPKLMIEQQQQQALQASTQTLIDQLSIKLKAQTDDVAGWRMLGRSYQALEQWGLAVEAFDQAYQLDMNHAATLLALAESLAKVEQGQFNLRAQALVATAYQLEPNNLDVLWMYGEVSQQQGDLKAAYQAWYQVYQALLPHSEEAQYLSSLLQEMERIINDVNLQKNE